MNLRISGEATSPYLLLSLKASKINQVMHKRLSQNVLGIAFLIQSRKKLLCFIFLFLTIFILLRLKHFWCFFIQNGVPAYQLFYIRNIYPALVVLRNDMLHKGL